MIKLKNLLNKSITNGVTNRQINLKLSSVNEGAKTFSSIKEEETKSQDLMTKVIKISFECDWNPNIGKVEQEITLAASSHSLGIYKLAPDIEKFIGLSKKDAKKRNETPDDTFIYGMANVMNGGKDIFFWTNGTRLTGAVKKVGLWPAIMEQISHESVHLARLILCKHILEKNGSKDWVNDPWPSIGDNEKENLIDEESFATTTGNIVEQIANEFLNMSSKFIPELKQKI